MQISKGIKMICAAVLAICIAAYIVYSILLSADDKDICAGIELNIEKQQNTGFVNNSIIEQELRNANIFPTGRRMCDISTGKIEKVLRQNEFIENAECYKTANNNIVINITERTPVIYILPENGDGYYVDRYGKSIKRNNYPVNMPVATGKITPRYAEKRLSHLGAFLLNNDFWNDQIEQINVSVNSDKEFVIDLIPRVGKQTIHLGTIKNFQKKLDRMMIFYQKAVPVIGWDKYSLINLEYEGQIICKKQK